MRKLLDDYLHGLTFEPGGGSAERLRKLCPHGRLSRIAESAGAPVPEEAVFISDEPLSDYDIRRTNELAALYGWRDL